MSRHVVRERPNEVAIGWDQPLESFFVIVYAGEKVLLWLGDRPRALYDLEDLKRALGTWRLGRLLTPEIERELYLDRDEGR